MSLKKKKRKKFIYVCKRKITFRAQGSHEPEPLKELKCVVCCAVTKTSSEMRVSRDPSERNSVK